MAACAPSLCRQAAALRVSGLTPSSTQQRCGWQMRQEAVGRPVPAGRRSSLTIAASAPAASTAAAAPAAGGAAASASGAPAHVVLTREQGKNGKLRKVLEKRGISCLELPMVETIAGPDTDLLPKVLAEQADQYDWVCITSPEAAAVFLEGWRKAGRPAVRLAVVGDGTGKVFSAQAADGVPQPQFVPSVANAEHFGPELPIIEGGSMRVLYPASNKASTELQSGLAARGFDVRRLNTYDTVPVSSLDPEALQLAKQAAVVTVGSPSAIKAWVQIVGEEATQGMSIACIGSTSARAAEKLGLQRIKYPDAPGVDTWAQVVVECLQERGLA